MTDDCGASVRKWTDVVRRADLDPTTKLVGLLVASYADADGTNIFPGLARLTVESGKGYSTVKRVLAWLRRVGLIECVRRPTRERPYAQYRLTLSNHLPEHVKVPTPAEHRRAVEALDASQRPTAHSGEPSPTAHRDEPSAQVYDPVPTAHSYEPDLEVDSSFRGSVPSTDQLSTTSQEERAPLRAITGGAEMPRTRAPNQPGLWPTAVPDAQPDTTVGDTPSVTAQTIVAEWIDRCAKRPPGRVVGQVAKYVREMLAEGVDADDIRRGVAAWMVKGLHPAVLPAVVNEVMNRGGAAPVARPSTTDQRVADAIERGRRLQALHDRQALGS